MPNPVISQGGARNTPQPLRGQGRGTPLQHAATYESHINAVGVRRPGFGVAGKGMQVTANFFKTTAPKRVIHHYDVISAGEKRLPARLHMKIIQELQTYTAPEVFSPPAAYDGGKNLFSTIKLPLGENDTKEFHVIYPRASQTPPGNKHPKPISIKLTKVAEINPEVLHRFLEGKQSYDSAATTAITAINVAVRMEPSMKYSYNVRSFFIEDDQDVRTGDLRNGLQLWQGYFQSVRPAGDSIMINIDITTGVVFEGGRLIDLCLKHLHANDIKALVPRPNGTLHDRDRYGLQHFTHGLHIQTTIGQHSPRVVRKFTEFGANKITHKDTGKTVAQYFHEIIGRRLQYPDIICVEVGNGALIPLELCVVIKGQLARRQVPPQSARDMVRFASKRPDQRLAKIRDAPRKLCYNTSSYVENFGLSIHPEGPITTRARVLDPPSLTTKETNKRGAVVSRSFIPKNGAWNMDKRKFFAPVSKIAPVAIFTLESTAKFTINDANACFIILRSVMNDLGVSIPAEMPLKRAGNPQGDIIKELTDFVETIKQKRGASPQLIIVILPELGNDLYTFVKYFGDVHAGIVTQCMRASKCKVENPGSYSLRQPCRPPGSIIQYYSNVALKINSKLGGVNMILSPGGANTIIDLSSPVIVMGADVVHPAPGVTGLPSYTALVGNIDDNVAKFVAETRIQDSRVEIIQDLKPMAVNILKKWKANCRSGDRSREARLLFYRDGVSEGQFPKVLETELSALKEALLEVKIVAKITLVVVGKRHHVRFFPRPDERDIINGNCPPGTVVDEGVCHPIEFDFYLYGHAGILGTSRPAHYSVLYDDNGFVPDTLQKFTYHFCYIYARATRAVSIPAPVYYASIVCSRAKNHYNPNERVPEADSNLVDKADKDLEYHKAAFKPLHREMENSMYFS